MAAAGMDDVGLAGEGRAMVTWTSAMSTFMLKHLAGIVEGGARTSTGFKMMHYNGCARVLNEHFRQSLTEQQNHKAEAEYINKSIENYREMQVIYDDRLATGRYAKGSTELIGATSTTIDCDEDEDVLGTHSINEGQSSATKPAKKAKNHGEEEGLISTLGRVGSELAADIVAAGEKAAPPAPPPTDDEVPDNLYETLMGIEGFSEAQVAHYFAFLVENPRSAKAFMKMGRIGQLTWMSRYMSKE